MSNSLWPHGLYIQSMELGSLSLLQVTHPNPGIKHRSPVLQVDSLPAEPPGKWTRNTTCFKTSQNPEDGNPEREGLAFEAISPWKLAETELQFQWLCRTKRTKAGIKTCVDEVLAGFQSGNHKPALRDGSLALWSHNIPWTGWIWLRLAMNHEVPGRNKIFYKGKSLRPKVTCTISYVCSGHTICPLSSTH